MEGDGLELKPAGNPQSLRYRRLSPTGIRIRVSRFKVWSDNHYTMGEDSIFNPYTRGLHGVGFEPTRFTTPGLKSGSLDHSDNRAFEQFRDLFRSVNYNVCCKHNYIQTTYKPINTIYTTKYAG